MVSRTATSSRTSAPARRPAARGLPRAWRHTARVFTALGDPQRQRILLMFERGRRLSIGEIVAATPLSRTAVVHHLRVLKEAGVIVCVREGRHVVCRPDPAAVRAAIDAVSSYLSERFE